MIRLLTFTNLYPSEAQPRHGIFVEQRLRRLVETGRVQASVVVPVPQPLVASATWDGRPVVRHGIEVHYFPYRVARGFTTLFHPRLMAYAARKILADLRTKDRTFDVLDAHFLYPDGVAAAHLAATLGLPLILTARGSDVNVALRERIAGRSIRWAVGRAAAVVAVSAALRDAMIESGIPADRITVLRNGVDVDVFRPGERSELRVEFGFSCPTLLAVGNLVSEKGLDLALAALVQLPGARLVVIGAGPQAARLREVAAHLGVEDRVRWLAPVSQAELARYYAAADITLLTSTREGLPNVLLESLACGTPIVATDVGGVSEVVSNTVAGRVVRDRSASSIAAACRELLATPADRSAVRRFAERFGWDAPTAGLLALLERVAGHA
jgi:glycosyltransferase involved in cell wall biosynthesis